MTNTGSEEYINGFLAGQMGKPVDDDATEEWLAAYARGKATEEAYQEVKREIKSWAK